MAQGPEGKGCARSRLALLLASSIAAPRELGGCRRSKPCPRWSVPCGYAVSFGLAEDSHELCHALASRSREESRKRHGGAEVSWNQICCLSAVGTCYVITGLRQTMTYTLSGSLDTRTHTRKHDKPADHNGRR